MTKTRGATPARGGMTYAYDACNDLTVILGTEDVGSRFDTVAPRGN